MRQNTFDRFESYQRTRERDPKASPQPNDDGYGLLMQFSALGQVGGDVREFETKVRLLLGNLDTKSNR